MDGLGCLGLASLADADTADHTALIGVYGPTAVCGLPPLPPLVPRPRYPRWRAGADAVVYAEALAEPRVFPAFERLCRLFRDLTGTRMGVCVILGSSPIVRRLMAAHGLEPERFLDRVRGLARWAVIGYHGHFFVPARDGDAPLTPMRHANFEEALEAIGVRYDFTLRPSLRNAFGEGYELSVVAIAGRPTFGSWLQFGDAAIADVLANGHGVRFQEYLREL